MKLILGLDFGTRRIGAAVSDPGRTIAFLIELHERRGPDGDARYDRELVEENDVDRIVVGLPLHTSGRERQLASAARIAADTYAQLRLWPIGRSLFSWNDSGCVNRSRRFTIWAVTPGGRERRGRVWAMVAMGPAGRQSR